jgi:hypothetical protein
MIENGPVHWSIATEEERHDLLLRDPSFRFAICAGAHSM